MESCKSCDKKISILNWIILIWWYNYIILPASLVPELLFIWIFQVLHTKNHHLTKLLFFFFKEKHEELELACKNLSLHHDKVLHEFDVMRTNLVGLDNENVQLTEQLKVLEISHNCTSERGRLKVVADSCLSFFFLSGSRWTNPQQSIGNQRIRSSTKERLYTNRTIREGESQSRLRTRINRRTIIQISQRIGFAFAKNDRWQAYDWRA